jgi:hypothetical protein
MWLKRGTQIIEQKLKLRIFNDKGNDDKDNDNIGNNNDNNNN